MLLMREWMASQFWMVHYGHCYAYSLWATAAECTPAETRVIMSNQWSFQLPSVLLLQGAQLEYVLFSLRLLLPLSWSTSPSTFPNHRLFSPVPPVHLSIGPIWVRRHPHGLCYRHWHVGRDRKVIHEKEREHGSPYPFARKHSPPRTVGSNYDDTKMISIWALYMGALILCFLTDSFV